MVKMKLRYTIFIFAVKLSEDHGTNLDRAELLFLSISCSKRRKKIGYNDNTSQLVYD